jgi:large subunit ribosomal protein L10
MPNQKNQDQIKLLTEKLENAKTIVIVDYSGTSVNDQSKLRASVKEAGGEMLVTKNTLMDIAFGKGKLTDSLEGMNAVVFSNSDEVSAIKKLFEFHKESDKLEIKQGIFEDKVLSPAEVEELSKMPGKEELIIRLINNIKGPGQGMVNVLNAGMKDLVSVLKNISKKESKE